MATTNAKVVDLLRQYAAVLQLERADRFKIKAYRRAADTVESLHCDLARLVASGADLKQFPGIGPAISRTIETIVKTGSFPLLEASTAKLPRELLELAKYPKLDPRQVLRVYKKLKLQTVEELREALHSGTVREHFGARVDFQLRHAFDERPGMLLYRAEPLAARIQDYLETVAGASRVSPVGSLRRKKDTVGDLNFLIAGPRPAAIREQFADFGGIVSTTNKSSREFTFHFSSGLQVGLVTTALNRWGLSLLTQTGSQTHLDELKQWCARKKLSLSPAALTKRRVDLTNEGAIYESLQLQFIEPELREGNGEVELAGKHELPRLIRREDLKGDLHMHTTASDGANTIAEMAAAAKELGYEYIAITDHSQSLKITNGLSEARLKKQIRDIDKFNEKSKDVVVLKGAEVDILEDGRLDYSDAVLKQLDFTICSIHSRFGLNRQQQTERILRAMDNRYFCILGHATGRLILKREGYELDIERILEHARGLGCFVEINSSPDRLDLSDVHARMAKERGIGIAINTDAHSVGELEFISAGLNQARRAWLEPADVLNTLTLPQLRRRFRR